MSGDDPPPTRPMTRPLRSSKAPPRAAAARGAAGRARGTGAALLALRRSRDCSRAGGRRRGRCGAGRAALAGRLTGVGERAGDEHAGERRDEDAGAVSTSRGGTGSRHIRPRSRRAPGTSARPPRSAGWAGNSFSQVSAVTAWLSLHSPGWRRRASGSLPAGRPKRRDRSPVRPNRAAKSRDGEQADGAERNVFRALH